jgi:GntR family transcriptional regulator
LADVSISISLSSAEPIYRQIEDQVRAQIVSGALPEGAELPSIRALAQDLRVSVITVKRAYDDLEEEGLTTAVPGRGSYVAVRNRALFREQRMRLVEQKLEEAARYAKLIGMTLEELAAALAIVYGEENRGSGTAG